ncbi:hypothetical protein DDN23_09330 [Vibrio cholerae]|nr:hypothetical protein [Vibrio cholerae]EGR3977245.1 hypothetical protein [Vibrio cholerae]MDN6979227.1 hypothetical protein [Vibrio cholerae]TXY41449.1 hypothetical protein FXE84_15275 [Vibrio cholerae]
MTLAELATYFVPIMTKFKVFSVSRFAFCNSMCSASRNWQNKVLEGDLCHLRIREKKQRIKWKRCAATKIKNGTAVSHL